MPRYCAAVAIAFWAWAVGAVASAFAIVAASRGEAVAGVAGSAPVSAFAPGAATATGVVVRRGRRRVAVVCPKPSARNCAA